MQTDVADSDPGIPEVMTITDKPEPNTRYLMLQNNYIAQKAAGQGTTPAGFSMVCSTYFPPFPQSLFLRVSFFHSQPR